MNSIVFSLGNQDFKKERAVEIISLKKREPEENNLKVSADEPAETNSGRNRQPSTAENPEQTLESSNQVSDEDVTLPLSTLPLEIEEAPQGSENLQEPQPFDPEIQANIVANARIVLEDIGIGGINNNPQLLAQFISGNWIDDVEISCFFLSFDDGIKIVDGAIDFIFFDSPLDRVRGNELGQILPGNFIDKGMYCGAELYEVKIEGSPVLFVSLIGSGGGNQISPPNAIAVIWHSDPRS